MGWFKWVFIWVHYSSFADLGFLFRILSLIHPGSLTPGLGSQIQNLGSQIQQQLQRRGKNWLVVILFLYPQISRYCKYLIYWKRFESIDKEFMCFYPKNCCNLMGFIGDRIQGLKSTGSRIRISNIAVSRWCSTELHRSFSVTSMAPGKNVHLWPLLLGFP